MSSSIFSLSALSLLTIFRLGCQLCICYLFQLSFIHSYFFSFFVLLLLDIWLFFYVMLWRSIYFFSFFLS